MPACFHLLLIRSRSDRPEVPGTGGHTRRRDIVRTFWGRKRRADAKDELLRCCSRSSAMILTATCLATTWRPRHARFGPNTSRFSTISSEERTPGPASRVSGPTNSTSFQSRRSALRIYEHFLKAAGKVRRRRPAPFYTPRFLAELSPRPCPLRSINAARQAVSRPRMWFGNFPGGSFQSASRGVGAYQSRSNLRRKAEGPDNNTDLKPVRTSMRTAQPA